MKAWKIGLGLMVLMGFWGCATAESPSTESASSSEQVYVVRGKFLGPSMEGDAMRVTHEEIPGYMAAMTMDFPLRDGAEIEGLSEGDKIEFTLTLTEFEGVAHSIKKLDPATELSIP